MYQEGEIGDIKHPDGKDFVAVSMEEEADKQEKMAPLRSLFRFASRTEIFLIALGTISAVFTGGIMSTFTILWGQLTNHLVHPNNALPQA
jgi:hypothetical protein